MEAEKETKVQKSTSKCVAQEFVDPEDPGLRPSSWVTSLRPIGYLAGYLDGYEG
jgi:hypothetical protein